MEQFLVEQSTPIFKENNIVIFCERNGRKYNTYIVGWDTSDDEIKDALDKMKKKFGCGGAIKKITFEGIENTKSLNLQGNFVIKVSEFMKTLKVQNLIIKELVE